MARGYFLTERDREDLQEILRAFRSGAFAQPSKNKSHRELAAIQEIAIGNTSDTIPADGDGLVDRWTVTDDEFAAVVPTDQVTAYGFTGGAVPADTKVILVRVAHKEGTRWVALNPSGGETLDVYNDSGEEIPAYGCMAVSGLHTDPAYIKVTKPSTTFRRQYLPNGATPIPIAETGSIPVSLYYKWLYNTGTPANDEGYGPTPGQWYLTLNYPAVTEVAGIFDVPGKVLLGTVHPINKLIGKLADTLTPGGTATVNIWAGIPEAVIASLTVTGRDWLMRSGSITAGTKVVLDFPNGVIYVIEASCGP